LLLAAQTAWCGAACIDRTNSEDQHVTTEPDPIVELLRLADEEYFSVTEDSLVDLQNALSERVEGDGGPEPVALPPRVALGAPRRVDLSSHETVPVLLGTFQTGLRGWQVRLDPNTLFFVKDAATGELAFSHPKIDLRRGQRPLLSGAGAPPDELNATSTSAGVSIVDLKEKMAERLSPGSIAVTAVVYDICSNTVEIDLSGEASDAPPATQTVAYVRDEVDRSVQLETAITVPETGSSGRGFTVRVATQAAQEQLVQTAEGRALLPSHLVLVRLDENPLIVPAFVPVHGVETASGGTAYNAHFTVTLGGAGYPIPSGEYRLYCDLGRTFRGPFALKVTE
jgi:hypothetical protein